MANALLNNTLRSCKILDKFYGCLRRNYLLINTHCNQDLSYPDKEVDGWKYTVELTNHKEQQLQFCLFLKRKFLVSFKSKSANLEFEEVLSCRVVKFNYVTRFIYSQCSQASEKYVSPLYFPTQEHNQNESEQLIATCIKITKSLYNTE